MTKAVSSIIWFVAIPALKSMIPPSDLLYVPVVKGCGLHPRSALAFHGTESYF